MGLLGRNKHVHTESCAGRPFHRGVVTCEFGLCGSEATCARCASSAVAVALLLRLCFPSVPCACECFEARIFSSAMSRPARLLAAAGAVSDVALALLELVDEDDDDVRAQEATLALEDALAALEPLRARYEDARVDVSDESASSIDGDEASVDAELGESDEDDCPSEASDGDVAASAIPTSVTTRSSGAVSASLLCEMAWTFRSSVTLEMRERAYNRSHDKGRMLIDAYVEYSLNGSDERFTSLLCSTMC